MQSVDVQGKGGSLKLIESEVTKHRADEKKLMTANDDKTLHKPIHTHDMLKYGRGASPLMTFIWWIIGKPYPLNHESLTY